MKFRHLLILNLTLIFVALSIVQPPVAAQTRGDTEIVVPGQTTIFPAQWDPKLGIHVT